MIITDEIVELALVEWKKPLYEDGKTPDRQAIDEAAAEFRRKNIAISGKE